MRDYGQCFKCKRIVPVFDKDENQFLFQIRFYSGHIRKGSHHHKTICLTCKMCADEAAYSGESICGLKEL